jgi:predicted ATP-binding protein involved in virulence
MEKEQQEKILAEIFQLTNNISNSKTKFSYLDFLIDIKFFFKKTISLFIDPIPINTALSDLMKSLPNQEKYQKYGEWTIFIAHLTRLYDFIEVFETDNQISNTEVIKEIKNRIVWLTSWLKNFIYKKNNPQELSKDIFINLANSAQPFHLKSFKIKEYQNLKDISIDNIPVDAQFIVFTGDNGEGKTNILRALTVGMYGNNDEYSNKLFIWADKTYIFIEAKYENEPIINEFKGFASTDTFITKTFNIVAYGASRLQLQGAMSQAKEDGIQSPIHGLFDDNSFLLNIVEWIRFYGPKNIRLEYNDNDIDNINQKNSEKEAARAKSIVEILNKILPSVDVILKNRRDIEFQQKNDNQKNVYTQRIEAKDLSAGNKSILAMIGDMMIRLYQQQPDVVEVSDLQGIVLIDELETHLHPKWQKEFPRLLSELFPKIQFIITTHSPLVFLGMPPDKTVVYNVGRDENNQTEVKKLNLDLANMLPHEILTSALFDMENIRNVHNQGIEYLSVETTAEKKQREIEEEILARLSQKFKFNLPESDDKNN